MPAVEKALWYIENHYRDDVSLATIARVAGVSQYHLSRIFCYTIGLPCTRYMRLRRLSKGAIALAAGERDILNLALSLGYGSHEAFSRAFKAHFHKTPEQVRNQGHTNNLNLLEAKTMQQTTSTTLSEPRFEQLSELVIVGLSRHYPFEKVGAIPDQWQSFAELIPRLTSKAKPTTFGVIYNAQDDCFDYLSGVEFNAGQVMPPNVVRLEMAPQEYAVFEHTGHVAQVRQTCDAIWSRWLPESKAQVAEAPWFERYGDSFNPHSGTGGLEIWIPLVR
jgi:AraC family transcriptional regulator